MSSLPRDAAHMLYAQVPPTQGQDSLLPQIPQSHLSVGLRVRSRICSAAAAGSSAKPTPRGLLRGKFLRKTGPHMKRSTMTPKPLPPGTSPRQTEEAVPGICTPQGNHEGTLMETGSNSGAGASAAYLLHMSFSPRSQLNRDLQAGTCILPNTDWLYGRHHPFCTSTIFFS